MKRRTILFVIAAALPVMSAVAAGSQGSDARRGDARSGAAKFHDYGCVLCHGTVGQSSTFGTPPLDPKMPIDGLRWKLRNKSGVMPAFSEKILTEKDVEDLSAFIAGFPR